MATKVLGMRRLRKKLRSLPEFAKKEISAAMEVGAQEVVDLARSLVPVEDGDLRDSIGWTWGDPPSGSIALGQVKSRKSELHITIYAGNDKAFYARWVEFGTAPHAQPKRGTHHKGASPSPFFFPSYRALRRRIKSRVTRSVTKSAKRAAGVK